MTITRLKTAPRLRVVADVPPPDLSYEWRDRQRIARKNWAAVHIQGDRRAPVFIPDRPSWKGWWR
jgi:hypothetical protein